MLYLAVAIIRKYIIFKINQDFNMPPKFNFSELNIHYI